MEYESVHVVSRFTEKAMLRDIKSPTRSMLFAMILVAAVAVPGPSQSSKASQSAADPAKPGPGVGKTYLANHVPRQEQLYYLGLWGIDSLKVKYTESGEIIRFNYRVVDPAKAAPLNDKKAEPFLYDPQAGVKLVVPEMEKVGKLRQSSTPVNGMSYWMAFSNSGRRVRPGHRVNVQIGNFHAMNLVVE
jgi:hypothetical protein